MMERLSGKDELGYYAPRNETLNCLKHRGDLVDRLAYYEDMEEQGRLVVLPVKEGTEVYKINYRLNGNHEITKTWFSLTYIKPNDFGKTVFLTREEAEQALKGGAN